MLHLILCIVMIKTIVLQVSKKIVRFVMGLFSVNALHKPKQVKPTHSPPIRCLLLNQPLQPSSPLTKFKKRSIMYLGITNSLCCCSPLELHSMHPFCSPSW
ncbi:hypothetical protein HMPREF1544_08016 [Mucor circinelloides 1006PhL]|uniref:Uncharacterized protein n=1 Tax=Mucor circinelloides f. circinelloides (strain 1006PhL) TaxID=1220926 RepID=S2J693_MUCC1|nr:hypothetical protein HMPREF1544_08016 [Mucor circinelloides 1006PhL]